MASNHNTTVLLRSISLGDRAAIGRLFEHVYEYLRAIADEQFRNQPRGHTLQPTALVHETFLKLARGESCSWRDRAHFLAVASTAMRQILVDHARHRATAKRGGKAERNSRAAPLRIVDASGVEDVLTLHDMLLQLSTLHPRQATIVEMRFFGGMTAKEIAATLAVSKSTVDNDWLAAKAWLGAQLRRGTAS